MPGENSGGGADAGYKPPAPKKNPGGKNPHGRKRGQTTPPRRPTPAPQPHRPKPPQQKRYPSSGGSGGSNNGGGSYPSSNSSGAMSLAAPAPPAPPSLNEFLGGDTTYQSQLAALNKALANYKSQMGETTDEYNADFTRRLGDLNLSETRATTDQADDYAGRGLYISGLYGKARGDLEQDYDNRQGDMELAKQQYLAGLNRDLTNYNEDNNLSREKAKNDAIQRRSLQYGL